MFLFLYLPSYVLPGVTFVVIITVSQSKDSTVFVSSTYVFKRTVLQIWLNLGINQFMILWLLVKLSHLSRNWAKRVNKFKIKNACLIMVRENFVLLKIKCLCFQEIINSCLVTIITNLACRHKCISDCPQAFANCECWRK